MSELQAAGMTSVSLVDLADRRRWHPRRIGATLGVMTVACVAAWSAAVPMAAAARGSSASRTTAAAGASRAASAHRVVALVRMAMRANGLKAAIVSVRVGNRDVVTTAIGDSMTR